VLPPTIRLQFPRDASFWSRERSTSGFILVSETLAQPETLLVLRLVTSFVWYLRCQPVRGYIPPGTHPLSPAHNNNNHHHHHQHHQNLLLPALLQMDRPEESALFPELPREAHITIARLGHSILDTFERLEVGTPVANERHCTAVLTHKPRSGNNGYTHSHTELDLRSQGRIMLVVK
jgi:hypothetical protein